MTTYNGPLNVLQDTQGSVIPITLNPSDIPVDGLTIDVSRFAPPNGNFGYIAGLTVDATGTNIAAGIVSIYFAGGLDLIRNANGGNTQVYKVSGPCSRIVINKLAWTSGPINFILWNTSPSNELQSPLNVIASGAVTISGTPTIQFAAGQSVQISSGAVNINGTVTIEPGAHQLVTSILQPLTIGNTVSTLLGSGTNGAIRTIFLSAMNMQTFQSSGYLVLSLQNVAQTATYWQGICAVSNIRDGFINITNLTLLSIPFTGGLIFNVVTHNIIDIDSQSGLNCVVGWN